MKNTLPYIQKIIATLFLSTLFISAANAAPIIMSAPDANEALEAGKMILLDIRSAEEWKDDGVAKGAFPVSMHDSNFGKNLNRVLAQRGDKQIGLICATGGRTQYVAGVLEQNGVKDVVNVSESMHGNGRGPGWIKRKLPIVSVDKALKHFEDSIK